MRPVLAAILLLAATAAGAQEPVVFVRDVWPIFVRNCIVCHGVKQRYANLELDSPGRILQGGDTARAVVPRDPEASEVLRRISLPPDALDFMPRERTPLSAGERELVRRWIAEGASFGSWVGMAKGGAP
jgi:hypothetical protein